MAALRWYQLEYRCGNDSCRYSANIRHKRPFIITGDKLENNKCYGCNKLTLSAKLKHTTAVQIELQDSDNPNEIDRLTCYLFEQNTKGLKVGETVIIDGNICVINKNDNRKHKFIPALYGNSIFYENREELLLTEEDKQTIKSLYQHYSENAKNNKSWIDFLVSIFAPNIARNYNPKLGILLAAASSGPDEVYRHRDRIHVILVGEPGLAKSVLIFDGTLLVSNSRYMSMSNTSGISLTAMIEKDEIGGGYNLRIGSIPLAKNSIFGANEIGELNFKNQLYLGDIMEEGVANVSKYTIDADIIAPVTMISACNPSGTNWKFDNHIELTEIPLPLKELDRYDLPFFLRMPRDPRLLKEFAQEITKCERENPLPIDYTFLQKVILYSKTFRPKLSDKAIEDIEEAWVKFVQIRGSIRVKDILVRLAKAFARLKLKSIADTEDADDAIELYSQVMYNTTAS
ncbi:MAG TPA: hypothetical protein VFI70_09515 [Nitrososphaeraceae archaeon]|nr:hypothetical protein [Nitrososphaeraceae archaeon]